jgi:hypothetical protein
LKASKDKYEAMQKNDQAQQNEKESFEFQKAEFGTKLQWKEEQVTNLKQQLEKMSKENIKL